MTRKRAKTFEGGEYKTRVISIAVGKTDIEQLAIMAGAVGMSRSAFVRALIKAEYQQMRVPIGLAIAFGGEEEENDVEVEVEKTTRDDAATSLYS